MDKYEILEKYFGYKEFRKGQGEIIDNIMSGRDILGIMPTGAGKSLCYQIPALMLPGITVVVSPLISLMKDQVSALVQNGIRAAYINSSLTYGQYVRVVQNAAGGMYKIIYVAPERLLTQGFQYIASHTDISMVTVDEAHCVSQWGQDFRPDYLKITEFIKTLEKRPVISAFTATATKAVRDDIQNILCLNDPYMITTGFNRENLYFEVRRTNRKFDNLIEILSSHREDSSIVYCGTRKLVEEVCERLDNMGYSVTKYHAALGDEERRKNQDDFIFDRKLIMVATNAFGMGIDKSNVSLVVHYNMPGDIESYYQEAGRAGRDGEKADCVLLYSKSDVALRRFFIERKEENEEIDYETLEKIKERDFERLKYMTFYCTCPGCLRERLLKYFGETPPKVCGNCSGCKNNYEDKDVTEQAQKILSCVRRVKEKGLNIQRKLLCAVLRGSNNERISKLHLDELPVYGIMTGEKERDIMDIVDFLVNDGYMTIDEMNYRALGLSEKAKPVLEGKASVYMKIIKEDKPIRVKKIKNVTSDDEALFNELKILRNDIARKAMVPAYVVFTDASLRDMCRKLPKNDEEFLQVSGVGLSKTKKYGRAFMDKIKEYKG